ncbi:MAG: SRPBCC family protein [Pseudomonadota bacterium]
MLGRQRGHPGERQLSGAPIDHAGGGTGETPGAMAADAAAAPGAAPDRVRWALPVLPPRLYRQRRRLAVTALATALLLVVGDWPDGARALMVDVVLSALLFALLLALFVTIWPSARREATTGMIAYALVLIPLESLAVTYDLSATSRVIVMVGAIGFLPQMVFALLARLGPTVSPWFTARVALPLSPEAALARFTDADGRPWSPAVARVEHEPDGYLQRFRATPFQSGTIRHTVLERRPGRLERTRFEGSGPMLGHLVGETETRVVPTDSGSLLTYREKTRSLTLPEALGAWLDDSVGGYLDHFRAQVDGGDDDSLFALDQRALGLRDDDPDRVF